MAVRDNFIRDGRDNVQSSSLCIHDENNSFPRSAVRWINCLSQRSMLDKASYVQANVPSGTLCCSSADPCTFRTAREVCRVLLRYRSCRK